jgi:hypothetical protein
VVSFIAADGEDLTVDRGAFERDRPTLDNGGFSAELTGYGELA